MDRVLLYAFTYLSGIILLSLGLVPLWVGIVFSVVLGLSLKSFVNSSFSRVLTISVSVFLLVYVFSRFFTDIFELGSLITFGVVLFAVGITRKKAMSMNMKLVSIILLAIVSVALFLRVTNLTNLYPYTDEYAHLVAGKTLVNEGGIEYIRAKFVTYMVSIGYLIGQPETFYEHLFWGRLPGAIFSSLTVIPIYLLGSRISKKVGIISALLWAISPWSIGVGRAVREYAYYPFFTTSFLYLVWGEFDQLLLKKFDIKRLSIFVSGVSIFLIYALLIDYLSTLKISLLMFITFAVAYCLSNFAIIMERFQVLRQQKWFLASRKYLPYVILAVVITVCLGVGIYAFNSPHASLSSLTLRPVWVWYFFQMNNLSVLNWWDNSGYSYSLILILFGLYGIIQVKNQRRGLGVISIVFFLLLVFYVSIFDRYARPRYIFHLVPLYTIFIGMGIAGLINFFVGYSRRLGGILVIILFVALFPVRNATFAIQSTEHGYIDTTNEFHNDITQSLGYIQENVQSDDTVIATIMVDAIYLSLDIDKKNLYRYNSQNPERFTFVHDVVDENDSGWMILDTRRNGGWSKGYPHEGEFLIANKKVTVEQNLEGIQIYRW